VTRADYAYTVDAAPYADTDAPSNWRTEALLSRPNDPMGSRPAPMIDELPSSRPMHMTWEYDWLGNAEMWNDDANQFYERSIGDITNGADLTGTVDRPGAIRIAHNLVPAAVGADHGGWLEVEYGLDGNVSLMTVHANCRDDNDDSNGDSGLEICQPYTVANASYGSRVSYLRDRCICAQEQHYNYRWDELNRIAEAMRFDRTGGSGTWTPMVRQRYLYDSANERTVKQTLDLDVMSSTPEAVALYVYPGDFERRGLVRNAGGTSYTALPGAETQYVVGGARLVWRTPTRNPAIGIDRDQRLTIGLSDLIQSTSATLDLLTGELVETSNYYANGARESYRASTNGDRVAPEPMGFTGKEADEEVGLTYFGQRYLMSHLGRWASPDPLQVHAVGGGEALNGYHYVAGNVLQARDPIGLDGLDLSRDLQTAYEPLRPFGVSPSTLKTMTPNVSFYTRGFTPPGASGAWEPMFNGMNLSGTASDRTLIHESTHGYLDLMSGRDSRVDSIFSSALPLYSGVTSHDGTALDAYDVVQELAAYYVGDIYGAHVSLEIFYRTVLDRVGSGTYSAARGAEILEEAQLDFEEAIARAADRTDIMVGGHEVYVVPLDRSNLERLNEIAFGTTSFDGLRAPEARRALEGAGIYLGGSMTSGDAEATEPTPEEVGE
jgi:RHS repeat-associated protein